MPPSKVTYTLPTDAPPSVVKEDGIEYGFICKLQRIKPGNGCAGHTICSDVTCTTSKTSSRLEEKVQNYKSNFAVYYIGAMGSHFMYGTKVPLCLRLLAKNNNLATKRGCCGCRQQCLFIIAYKLYNLKARAHHEIAGAALQKITSSCHEWRSNSSIRDPQSTIHNYSVLTSFCKLATTAELAADGFVRTRNKFFPWRSIDVKRRQNEFNTGQPVAKPPGTWTERTFLYN